MEIVQHYLENFLEGGEEAFLTRFNHPFLLYPEKHGAGGFATYHTRMADRGAGAKIAGRQVQGRARAPDHSPLRASPRCS